MQIKTNQEHLCLLLQTQDLYSRPCENMVYRLSLLPLFFNRWKKYDTLQVMFVLNYIWHLDVTRLSNIHRMFITPLNTNLIEAMKNIVEKEAEDEQLPWERVVVHHYTIITFVVMIIVIIGIYL